MFNIDLKAIAKMENHRGVGYVIFIASLFPISFLALSFLQPELVEKNLLLSVLMATSLGLTSSALCTVAIFHASINVSPEKLSGNGAKSLMLGSSLSMFTQALLLLPALATLRIGITFSHYALAVLMLVFGYVFTFTALASRHERKRKSAGKVTAEAASVNEAGE